MKVLSFLLIMVLCFTGLAFAETLDMSDAIDKIPVEEVKEGVLYSWDDNKIKPATSYSLLDLKELSLDLGYIIDDEEAFIGVSYNLINLREDLNVTAWFLDLVEVSITAGYGLKRIGVDNEGDPITGLGLIRWKF